jgi:hypothetical protein
METQAFENLIKAFPIAGSVIVLGVLAIKAITKYVNKRDAERDEFFKDQLEKKDIYYQEQLAKKDRLIEIKDQKLEELNLRLVALTKENIDVNNSLKVVIERALERNSYKQ